MEEIGAVMARLTNVATSFLALALILAFTIVQPSGMAAIDAGPLQPEARSAGAPAQIDGGPDLSGFVEVARGERLNFFAEPASYAQGDLDRFATDAEMLLREVSDRLGERLEQRVSFYLHRADQEYFSALSFFGPSLVYQQFGNRSSSARTRAVIAHELAHHITSQSLGYPKSLVHLEGIAHWASEPYWITAEGRSFDDRLRHHLAAGKALPLNELSNNPSHWKGTTQPVAYDEAASFVGYLIRRYGLDRFKEAYVESNYEAVYGEGLADLEKDWLASLRGR